MNWHSGLESLVRQEEPLAERTTFAIGGRAAYFAEPATEAEFAACYAAALRSRMPVYILGGGSNLLVSDDGVRGIVICTTKMADKSMPAPNHPRFGAPRPGSLLQLRAGTSLEKAVLWTARAGLSGLECLAGIPGTVGGAVRMNAGGRYGMICDAVHAVWCADRQGGIYMRDAGDIQWGYRATDLTDPIVRVEFDLQRKPAEAVRLQRQKILSEKRASQPMLQRSAGCFFKNPGDDKAGELIELAGLKGYRIGEACVSPKHANFIVNLGGATAHDVVALSDAVRDRVYAEFDVSLENEVSTWGLPRERPPANRLFATTARA
jgi:UDP-N-acetylmuramate dehydrogenase